MNWMNLLIRSCSILLFFSLHSLFSYENKYEGINPIWQAANTVESRLEIVSYFIRENPTVFEVGAFNGNESVGMSRQWPEGKIISFEPNPKRFAEYQENTKLCSNTIGYNLAVNTYNGTADFYLCWGYGGNNAIYEGASSLLKPSKEMELNYEGPVITVPCVVLDDWCKANQIQAIDFMWLDLEGFELQLLKSSPEILKTVQAIYTETNFQTFRLNMTRFEELDPFLEENGFERVAHWFLEGYQGDALYVRKK